MANDITTTSDGARLITDASEEVFADSTGYSRDQATRTVNAVLTVIGATMNDDVSSQAQFGGAVNVLGMAVSEVIASAGGTAEQRASLIKALMEFITRNSDSLAKHYEDSRRLATFAANTTDADLKPNAVAGVAN